MKINNLSKLSLAFILSFAVLFSSCESWIDTDINISPNNPSDVPMKLLLPSIQANIAYSLEGNDLVRPTNIWLQYYNGVARQSYSQAHYVFNSADVDNLWNTIYADIFMDIEQVLAKADETNSPYYEGVAKVCLAFTLGTATDVWGAIPYTEAMGGSDNLSPVYDSQESIYGDIQTLLDEAIAALSQPENTIPLENDLIYGGDVSLWIKAAWSLKARYAITLSNVNGAQAYTDALTYLSNGFGSSDEDFVFHFDDTYYSPLYAFMDERSGDLVMGSTFIDMLQNDSDPRILVFSADGSASVGSEPGTTDDGSLPGVYSAGKSAAAYMMTYSELKFIEAEALLASGDATNAYAAFQDGAMASSLVALHTSEDYGWVTEADIEGTTWWGVISVGANNLTQEMIMTQKYIAGYNTAQPYVDYRRTGFPVLNRATGATADIPYRFPYAQTELNYNSNVPSASLYDKLWWDNN